jgi:phage shock protein A
VMFEMQNRRVKFSLPFPNAADFKFTEVRRVERSAAEQKKAFEQACRQRWRALVLAIKAKLEAVESNIATFEQEFLSYIVLPNQQTVSEFVMPQLEAAYNSGAMPKMLPGIDKTVH